MIPTWQTVGRAEGKRFIAKFPLRAHGHHDDVMQEALMGAWQAEQAWDGRGNLVGFIKQRTRWALGTWVASRSPLSRRETRAGRPWPEPTPLEDLPERRTATMPAVTDGIARRALLRALATLTATRRHDVIRSYAHGETDESIARRRGASKQSVWQSRRLALAHLRRVMAA